MGFASEKVPHILGIEADHGGGQQIVEDLLQVVAGTKEDVGRERGLIDDPVVVAEARVVDLLKQRIHQRRLAPKM